MRGFDHVDGNRLPRISEERTHPDDAAGSGQSVSVLFLGVTLPTVLYILWGVMEVASIPLAKRFRKTEVGHGCHTARKTHLVE
jgi:hypothetical protein